MADGGNQTRVEVGAGVSVGGIGVETASHSSREEQDERSNVRKPERKKRLKVIGVL